MRNSKQHQYWENPNQTKAQSGVDYQISDKIDKESMFLVYMLFRMVWGFLWASLGSFIVMHLIEMTFGKQVTFGGEEWIIFGIFAAVLIVTNLILMKALRPKIKVSRIVMVFSAYSFLNGLFLGGCVFALVQLNMTEVFLVTAATMFFTGIEKWLAKDRLGFACKFGFLGHEYLFCDLDCF